MAHGPHGGELSVCVNRRGSHPNGGVQGPLGGAAEPGSELTGRVLSVICMLPSPLVRDAGTLGVLTRMLELRDASACLGRPGREGTRYEPVALNTLPS